ncbi:MAG: hypothetical protein ACQEP8_03910 [Chlamydiota bacterium]
MLSEDLSKYCRKLKSSFGEPSFYERVFALEDYRVRNNTAPQELENVILNQYEELSRYLDAVDIQNSSAARNNLRARSLATILIDDQGQLDLELLEQAIKLLEQHGYSLGPLRYYDNPRHDHVSKVLRALRDDAELRKTLLKISKPYANKVAEDLIKDTLLLGQKEVLKDAHVRRAVLSAWLCFLRQNVGSCFATAPSIIIQGEQPRRLLEDIDSLLNTGRLTRTFEGREYSVPLSTTWGVGDLKKSFPIEKNEQGLMTPVWQSPGLMRAFKAARLIGNSRTLKSKSKKIRPWIESAIDTLRPGIGVFGLNAEEVIFQVLLDKLKLDKKAVVDYRRSLQPSAPTPFSPPSKKEKVGKSTSPKEFWERYDAAEKAFKALTENALLKSWEFTIASFCDTKTDFSRWNLYSSLGFDERQPHGIGECMYFRIKEQLDNANREVHQYHEEYDSQFPHVKNLENRIKRATTEQEAQWIRMEYQRASTQLNFCAEQRDRARMKSKNLANLLNFLINTYIEKFPEYFQEVYDADIHDVEVGPYDDSPAGFRLLYKHGRTNTALWSLIYNEAEFVEALASFFTITESEIARTEGLEELQQEFSQIVTDIVTHVKTSEFLESAFYRMAKAHNAPIVKDPLNNIDKVEKKPWVYTSGGTMNTLINIYYRVGANPRESDKWVENESELLVHLIDNMREMEPQFSDKFVDDSSKSMLMHSPTHAFIFKPGNLPLREGWYDNKIYPYTWVRDSLVIPRRNFITGIKLDIDMIEKLVVIISRYIPKQYRQDFINKFRKMPVTGSVSFFCDYLLKELSQDPKLKNVLHADYLASCLHLHLPLTPAHRLADNVGEIFSKLSGITKQQRQAIVDAVDTLPRTTSVQTMISAEELQEVCKVMLLLELGTNSQYDYHTQINQAARELGLAIPVPIFFADTNWVKDYFAFTVSPLNDELELWRFDCLGRRGYPISYWKHWLNGSRQKPTWGIYTLPYQYGME